MNIARRLLNGLLVTAACSLPLVAEAHPGHVGLALRDGFLHPWIGWDHLLAMLAVGLWARQLQRAARPASAVLLLPALFVTAVAAGAIAGAQFGASGAVEALIATSLIALGALVATAHILPTAGAGGLVGAMGLVHGWAHGAEMPAQAPMLPYFAGFLAATALLHLLGVATANVVLHRGAAIVLRTSGVGIAALGCGLLIAG